MQHRIFTFLVIIAFHFNLLPMETQTISVNQALSCFLTPGEFQALKIPSQLGTRATSFSQVGIQPTADMSLQERELVNYQEKQQIAQWACTARASDGRTLLFFARRKSILEKIVKQLNYTTPVDNRGITPLIGFIQRNKTTLACHYIELHIQEFDRRARSSSPEEIDMALYTLQKALDYPSKLGTPLFFAITEGNDGVAQKLITCSAYINPLQKNSIGQSPFTASLELNRPVSAALKAVILQNARAGSKKFIPCLTKMPSRLPGTYYYSRVLQKYQHLNNFIEQMNGKSAQINFRNMVLITPDAHHTELNPSFALLQKFIIGGEPIPIEFVDFVDTIYIKNVQDPEKQLARYRDAAGRTLLYYVKTKQGWSKLLTETDYIIPSDCRHNTPFHHFLYMYDYKAAYQFCELLTEHLTVFEEQLPIGDKASQSILEERIRRIKKHLWSPNLGGALPLHLIVSANYYRIFELLYKSSFFPKSALQARDQNGLTPVELSYRYCPGAFDRLVRKKCVINHLLTSSIYLIKRAIEKGQLSFLHKDNQDMPLFLRIPFETVTRPLKKLFEKRFSTYNQNAVITECESHAKSSDNSKKWLAYLKQLQIELEDDQSEWSDYIEENGELLMATGNSSLYS